MRWCIAGTVVCLCLIMGCASVRSGEGNAMAGKELFFEDFSKGINNWWVEGGQKVWVADGRLHVKADPDRKKGEKGHGVATVWCKTEFPADIEVAFDAHVLSSSRDVNNINFFLSYSDPSGKPLFESRADRADGKYGKYHKLNGHIVTYLKDGGNKKNAGTGKGRIRIRHCPGFKLLNEAFDYECEQGKTYHVVIKKLGNEISVDVDGKFQCKATDPDPQGPGLIGCRTYCTYLWWDNIKVTALR